MSIAPKILVADDDQALSRTLSWILKDNGYEVVTVPGGEGVMEHLMSAQFDLLLLDIMMPKVDGLQLLERVKGEPSLGDLPVLMISSMQPEEATVKSLGLGASDFIAKPFRVRELLARVKAHLRTGRARRRQHITDGSRVLRTAPAIVGRVWRNAVTAACHRHYEPGAACSGLY
jgi:two-component system cell cycle response regulator